MEYQFENGSYQTGYTQPQKSYNHIIAFLLIVIVLLGGVATMLGLLNIQLFHQLSAQPDDADHVQFAQLATPELSRSVDQINTLGLSVTTLSTFEQNFYHLPQGVYITHVEPGSSAAIKGLSAGDIIISIENTQIHDKETLEAYLSGCAPKQSLRVVFFRDGKFYAVTLTTGGAK